MTKTTNSKNFKLIFCLDKYTINVYGHRYFIGRYFFWMDRQSIIYRSYQKSSSTWKYCQPNVIAGNTGSEPFVPSIGKIELEQFHCYKLKHSGYNKKIGSLKIGNKKYLVRSLKPSHIEKSFGLGSKFEANIDELISKKSFTNCKLVSWSLPGYMRLHEVVAVTKF